MIPALMLAELLNKRCVDLDAFIENRVMSCGGRQRLIRKGKEGKVFVLDDTIFFGNAMKKARERLAPLADKYDIIYGCIYAEGQFSRELVDIYFEYIWRPGENQWLYEWNILHHYEKKTNSWMWDIDGLLCKDPPNDKDTPVYEAYLPKAIPMIIPTTHIGALVTYRLEKYREITEKWLKEQGVGYGKLMMFNAPNRELRNNTMSPAKYKAQLYRDASWAKLFVESESRQAEKIHQLTEKPVFCYENGRLYL